MPPVRISVKSTLPEFGTVHILRSEVETDLTWEDFFTFNNANQFFNTVEHAIKSAKGSIAFGGDRIITTAQLFHRDYFTVRVIRRRDAVDAAFRGRRGPTRSLINVRSLIGGDGTRRVLNGNGSQASEAGAVQRGSRGRGRPVSRGRGSVSRGSSQADNAAANGSTPSLSGRGRGSRGGLMQCSGSRPVNVGDREIPLPDGRVSVASSNSIRATPRTPRARENSPVPHSSRRFPEDYIYAGIPGVHAPQNARRNYAESIDSELDGNNEDNSAPVDGSRKDTFLQLAARVPSADYDVYFNELQELKTRNDSYWRWSRKTPTIAHFLQMALRTN